MITVSLLFFGITSDLIGKSSINISIPEKSSIGDLQITLINSFPELKNISSYAIAVNEEYALKDVVLKENDTIAIIPPVSGG
ncbi:MoaD/ThiS family protein [Tenacibaculum sp.]|nr:MoaD/ThiS family protein [Tenacibaculum sp.]